MGRRQKHRCAGSGHPPGLFNLFPVGQYAGRRFVLALPEKSALKRTARRQRGAGDQKHLLPADGRGGDHHDSRVVRDRSQNAVHLPEYRRCRHCHRIQGLHFEIISGIIISFSSNEISVGDYLKIGTHKGKIIDLSLTKIAFLDEDDDIIFIPNTKVFSSEIVNYTKKQIRRVSIEFEAALTAVPSVEELEAYLTEALKDYHEYIEPGSFWLRVVDIRKDSLAMKFQYVLKQINRELELEIRRRTVRRIVRYVKSSVGEKGG
ncbi:MAG: mechanosensitive ion channel [Haliscomenobacter sp.]|nr:mechanosensitive ion channel [Haliscomenobacter sp.]